MFVFVYFIYDLNAYVIYFKIMSQASSGIVVQR